MTLPLHEIAALGTATCWAATGILSANAVRILEAFHFNLYRQGFVTAMLVLIVAANTGGWVGQSLQTKAILATSGITGLLIGDALLFAAVVRLGASGLAIGLLAATSVAPPRPDFITRTAVILTAISATLGLLVGMTLFLYALQGSQTGIIATLSATSPVIILPLLWPRTGQRPTLVSFIGAAMAVLGLGLIFLR